MKKEDAKTEVKEEEKQQAKQNVGRKTKVQVYIGPKLKGITDGNRVYTVLPKKLEALAKEDGRVKNFIVPLEMLQNTLRKLETDQKLKKDYEALKRGE